MAFFEKIVALAMAAFAARYFALADLLAGQPDAGAVHVAVVAVLLGVMAIVVILPDLKRVRL